MFCQNCGKKLPEGTQKCQECLTGFVVENTAKNVVTKKKKSKKKMIIAIVALVVFISAISLFSSDNTQESYTNDLSVLIGMSADDIKKTFGQPADLWEDGDSYEYTYNNGFHVSYIDGGDITDSVYSLEISEKYVNGYDFSELEFKNLKMNSDFLSVEELFGKPLMKRTDEFGCIEFLYSYNDDLQLIIRSDDESKVAKRISVTTVDTISEDYFDLGIYVDKVFSPEEIGEVFNIIRTEEIESGLLIETSAVTFLLDKVTNKVIMASPVSRRFHVNGICFGESISKIDLDIAHNSEDDNGETVNVYAVSGVLVDYIMTARYASDSGIITALTAQSKTNETESADLLSNISFESILNDEDYLSQIAWVIPEDYEYFIECFGTIYNDEICEDNNGDRYYHFSGAVPGLYTIMEACYTIDNDGYFELAYLKDGDMYLARSGIYAGEEHRYSCTDKWVDEHISFCENLYVLEPSLMYESGFGCLQITFWIDASPECFGIVNIGTSVGEVSGDMIMVDDSSYYVDAGPDSTLNLEFSDDLTAITATEEGLPIGGLNVSFNGEYELVRNVPFEVCLK